MISNLKFEHALIFLFIDRVFSRILHKNIFKLSKPKTGLKKMFSRSVGFLAERGLFLRDEKIAPSGRSVTIEKISPKLPKPPPQIFDVQKYQIDLETSFKKC